MKKFDVEDSSFTTKNWLRKCILALEKEDYLFEVLLDKGILQNKDKDLIVLVKHKLLNLMQEIDDIVEDN